MSLIKLQQKMGVTPDGSFGPKTLKAAMAYYDLTPERAAHFFGQTSHETGGFEIFSENLNHSGKGLLKTFPKYFTAQTVDAYARQPVKIASRVYANRMGNGDEASKQGYFFRGRGALQTTGKENYQKFADYIGNQAIMTSPELVATDYAFEAAMFFFKNKGLWGIADNGVNAKTILKISRIVNGGTKGLAERESLTNRYYSWLK